MTRQTAILPDYSHTGASHVPDLRNPFYFDHLYDSLDAPDFLPLGYHFNAGQEREHPTGAHMIRPGAFSSTPKAKPMTIIRHFTHNGQHYSHEMEFLHDTVTLTDYQDKALLIYDASCNVTDPATGKTIGRFAIQGDYWTYTDDGTTDSIRCEHSSGVESLLDSEVTISKCWIDRLLSPNQICANTTTQPD